MTSGDKGFALPGRLPLPPSGKTGWPWTEESGPLPPAGGGNPWPKISIVTPSFNQGRFLEETIRSVLLQNYPNLEYIIMDGGSTDNSVEIIKKYEPWLAYWISEKDGGQADAVYRGFEMATGEILAYINSDDYYLPDAFQSAAMKFVHHKERVFLIGCCFHADAAGKVLRKYYSFPQSAASLVNYGMHYCQPACFWKREAFFEVGGFERTLRYCFDFDLFLRLAGLRKTLCTMRTLAVYRRHRDTKSSTLIGVSHVESEQVKAGARAMFAIRGKATLMGRLRLRLLRLAGNASDMFLDPSFFWSKVIGKGGRE